MLRALLMRIAPLSLLVLAELMASAAASPAVDFVRPPEVEAATLSPSGGLIAYYSRRGGARHIVIDDLNTPATPSRWIDVRGYRVLWIRWTSEHRVLINLFVPPRFENGTLYLPAARTIATNVDGSDAVIMFGGQTRLQSENIDLSGVVSMLPDDPSHVIMAARRRGDLDLWRVNVFSGEAERIGVGQRRTVAWRVDSIGDPILRIDANRRGTVLTIMAPDFDGRGWDRVARVRESDQRDFEAVAIHPDPGRLYVVARPYDADRAAIYVYDARNREYVERIASDPDVDVTGGIVSASTGEFLGAVYQRHRVRFDLVDETAQSHLEALDDHFDEEANVFPVDVDAHGRRWLLSVSGPRDSGSLHVYDVNTRHVTEVGVSRPWLDRDQLSPMEVVDYPARDGRPLFGYLTMPRNPVGRRPPLIVMPHGGPEMRDYFDYNAHGQFLASRGYAVFQPNFRGSAGFGREFAEAGYREWGAAMQNDITDGVDHLAATGRIDGERVCIYGASYGGYAALAGAALTPDRYRCAISLAGVSDLRSFLEEVRRDRDRGDEEFEYWVSAIGHPRADRDMIDARSPRRLASVIQAPVLLIHGDSDGIVPVEQSREMAAALTAAGHQNEYLEVRDAGHSNWRLADEVVALERIEAFLKTHLPVDP